MQADRVTPFKFRSTADVDDAKLLWNEPSMPPSPSPPLAAHAKGSVAMRARSGAPSVELRSTSGKSATRSPETTPELRLAPRNKHRGSEVSIVDHERCLNCATLDDELLRAAKVLCGSTRPHLPVFSVAAAVCLLALRPFSIGEARVNTSHHTSLLLFAASIRRCLTAS